MGLLPFLAVKGRPNFYFVSFSETFGKRNKMKKKQKRNKKQGLGKRKERKKQRLGKEKRDPKMYHLRPFWFPTSLGVCEFRKEKETKKKQKAGARKEKRKEKAGAREEKRKEKAGAREEKRK